MPRWYYSTNGKAEGPVTSEFLVENLKNGRFTLFNLVFKEGDAAWKTFGEVPEFRDAFQPTPTAEAAPKPTTVPTIDISSFDANSPTNFQEPVNGWPSDWRLSSSWIVLRKRSDGGGYDQDGPFSAEHIIEMIGSGKIDYSQYCWKPGYTRWFRIGNLPEFDRRKRDRENDPVNQIVSIPKINDELPALSREELLANVERMRRARPVQENYGKNLVNDGMVETPVVAKVATAPTVVQPKPVIPAAPPMMPTAVAVAAVQTPPAPAKPVAQIIENEPRIVASDLAPKAPAAAPPAVASVVASTAKTNSFPKALRFLIAAAVAGCAVFAMVRLQHDRVSATPAVKPRPRQPTSVPAPPAAKPTIAPPKESANDLPPEIAPPAQAALTPPKAASVLEIVPLKLETSGPSLAFQTNSSPSETINVTLRARSGDILKYASYLKSFEVSRANGELPTLDLTKYSLPSGTYTVDATVGSVQTSKQVFIGQKDAAFVSALERHIKSIAYRQQLERSALFYGSAKLEKSTKDLLAQTQTLKSQPQRWRAAFEAWRGVAKSATSQVAALSQAPQWEVAYPDLLANFTALSNQLENQATQINEAMGQKRDVASAAPVDAVLTNLRQLRAQSAKLSGRPQADH